MDAPPLWLWKPGSLSVRRNAHGHYSVLDEAGRALVTMYGSSDVVCQAVANGVADYARCRLIADAVAKLETQRAAILRDLPPLPAGDRFSAELTGLDPEHPPTEPSPCPAAELDEADRALLLSYSGNPIWSHTIGGAA